MMGWSVWWVWITAGIVLAILEVLAPGYIFLGFAIGATLIGLILAMGGGVAAWLAGSVPLLLVIFATLSLASWFVLRKLMGVRKGQTRIIETDINEH